MYKITNYDNNNVLNICVLLYIFSLWLFIVIFYLFVIIIHFLIEECKRNDEYRDEIELLTFDCNAEDLKASLAVNLNVLKIIICVIMTILFYMYNIYYW
jgi:hypothetical protein